MQITKDRLIWSGIRGRNGADSPIGLADDEAVEVQNMDFWAGELGRKRRGSTAESLTDGPDHQIHGLVRHVPAGATETTAELWAIGQAALNPTIVVIHRRAPNPDYLWTSPTQFGTVAATRLDASAATLNGKLFIAAKSTTNRLRVWDGTSVRQVGNPPPVAPTVANTGAGAYAATLRYYRVAWENYDGTTSISRSELSPSVSFTPSGAGTAARVTQPARPGLGEGETHWLIYGSEDDVYSNFKFLSRVVVATTTYDDSTVPAAYSGEAPQSAGLNIPPPNPKFIITDGNRLLMAGAHETSATAGQTAVKNNRVWFTRVLGSSGIGDDESIPNTSAVGLTPAQKNWVDIGENDGGAITGMGIIEGTVFVFKRRQTWRLVPTGDDLLPYRAFLISPEIGAMNHKSIVAGEDADGAPVLYFYTYRGAYRLSLSGALTYIGRPIEDVWAAYPAGQPDTFGVYYAAKRQVWHHIAGSTGAACRFAVYDVLRGGWSLFTTASKTFTSAVMYAETVSGASGSKVATNNLKPYFGADGVLWKYDVDSAADDAGTTFKAYATSKPYFPAGLGNRVITHDAVVMANVASGVTLTLTVDRDFAAETKTATVLLTAAGTETRAIKRVEDSGFGSLASVQFTLGDASAVSNYWVADALAVPVRPQESLS